MPGNDDFSVDYLTESPEEGELHIDEGGKGFRLKRPDSSIGKPSLTAPDGGMGAFTAVPSRGLGGSQTGVVAPLTANYTPTQSLSQGPAARAKTPAELLQEADAYQRDFERQTEDARNPDGSYLSSLAVGSRAPKEGPPDWLTEYMSRQPPTDPYHQVMPGRLDIIKKNKYMTEQEKLKMIKYMNAK